MAKKHELPQIKTASALAPHTVRVTFDNGVTATVSLTSHLNRHKKVFAPLLEDAELWRQLAVDEWGWDINWDEDMAVPADLLWRLHLYQSGEAMAPQDFIDWMNRHNLTLDKAAALLGISRRQVAYYKSGEQLIPKTVRLACLGASVELGKAS